MQKIRKASAVIGALASIVIVGLLLLGVPGTAAQRGGGEPAPPTEFETLCVSVHNQLARAISSGACQSHEVTVKTQEDLPLMLCVNDITTVARAVDASSDCAARESLVEVTGFEDVEICVDKFTAVVRVPAPAGCQSSQIAGVLPSVVEPDSYESLPNVGIDVPAEAGLLANDAPGVEIVSADGNSQQGGSIRLPGTDGELIYVPPAGFVGMDSFVYTARIGESEVQVPVTIDVEGPVIWFVDNINPASDGDGTLKDPFPSLDLIADDSGAPDAPRDTIYVDFGNSGDDPYESNVVLEEGQKLIGAGVDLKDFVDIDEPEFSRQLPEPDFAPVLASDEGFAIRIAPDTTVAGFQMFEVEGIGIFGEAFFGDALISTVSVFEVGLDAVQLGDIFGTVTVEQSILVGGNGQPGADGRDGLNAFSVENIIINQTSMTGGDGADTGELPFAGDGGSGLSVRNTNVTMNGSTASGGFGGHNLNLDGGRGGNGVEAAIGGTIFIDGGVVSGGPGGNAGSGFGGVGGHGLHLNDASAVLTNDADARGAAGGGTVEDFAGNGGNGIEANNGGTLLIEGGASATGGPGGDADDGAGGEGGNGIEAQQTDGVTVDDASLFGHVGGEGSLSGAGDSGNALDLQAVAATVRSSLLRGAPVSPTIASEAGSSIDLKVFLTPDGPLAYIFEDNQLQSGDRDVPSIAVDVTSGSSCMLATGNFGNVADGPPLGGAFFEIRADGEFAITQDSLEGLSAANNGLQITVDEGQVGTGCTP